MNKIKYLIMLLFCMGSLAAMGQNQVASGTVSDDLGPLMGVYVGEIDAANRIVSATVTDMNGHFTLKVQNPKNKLRFTYMGFKTAYYEIGKRVVFDIMMEENSKVMKEVVVEARPKIATGGLDIPEREQSFSQQTIKMTEFEGLSFTSADEALQGRIAGLDIIATSGNLGSGTTMRLRGVSTIYGNAEPLIVVDDNIFETDANDNIDYSSMTDERFAELLSINPEDIESITVLKDAAATAIWGSKGANGVINIVTKRGVRGKPKLTYSLRLKGTYQPEGYKLLNGDEYTMLMKEELFNVNQNPESQPELNYDQTYSEYEQFNNNTDWRKEVKQFGLFQTHYVSLSGGGEKANYRLSAGYDHQVGSIIAQKLDRFTTRMMLDYYVSDRIKIISDFALTYTDNQRNSDDLLAIAYKKMPNLAIFEEDEQGNSLGRYYEMLKAKDALEDQRNLVNPIASAKYAKNSYTTYAIDPKLELQYDFLGIDDTKHRLTYNGKVIMNVFNAYEDTYYPRELSTDNWNASGVSRATSFSSKSLAFTTTHTLTFVPHFLNEDHSFMTMGRFQLVSGTSSDQKTEVAGLPNGVEAPSAGGITPGMSSNFNRWRSLYYTFSAHYAFKERYIFDVSARVDGTTKFGPGKRWGVFPAVSGRWNVVDEPWMEGTRKWLSMLSIRPGWGMTGNQPNKDYLYVNQYSAASNYFGATGMAPNNLKLNTLQWEMKYTWNVGFDLGFWDDRIKADINLYTQTTKDMLMENVRISSISGFTNYPYQNVGDMNNKGWEINLNTNKLIQKGKFWMDLNFTFANNKNEITRMDPRVLETLNSDWVAENRKLLQRVQVDNPFGAIYGYRYKGVYMYNYDTYLQKERLAADGDADAKAFIANFNNNGGWTAPLVYNANGEIVRDMKGDPLQMMFNYVSGGTGYEFKGGDAIYEDVNHDGNINQLDIVYLGNSLPKLTGGFGFKFNYGDWALNAQFNYRVDYDIVNLARLDMESMGSNNNQSQAVNYRWRKEGDFTSIPRALSTSGNFANYNTMISDRFVEDGTFLRLNYLQISYNMPQKMVKKIGLSGLRFYLSGNNLFCLTKYSGVDPELGYGGYSVTQDAAQTPRAKSYTFGVTVDF